MVKNSYSRILWTGLSLVFVLAIAAMTAGCGGGGGDGGITPSSTGGGTTSPSGGATSASATTTLSDPAPCTNTYDHAWITVTGVLAHMNANGSSGFTDLTPTLHANPVQVDLLSAPNTDCLLSTLGNNVAITAGTYQQIRILLLANSAPPGGVTPPSPNNCAAAGANVFNCVQLHSDGSIHALSLPSEANTGIKIPPGQLGPLTVAAGQAVDIDIDFNACQSIVQAGKSGKFKLKPTLRASELGTNPKITGTIVWGTISGSSVVPMTTTIAGANVWLEAQARNVVVEGGGSDAVENLVMTTTSDSAGTFSFCPVSPGSYEIVADADTTTNIGANGSNATVTTGVPVTSTGGAAGLKIPLVADTVSAASLEGAVTTQAASSAGTGDDVALAALQKFSSVQALIPFFSSTSPIPPVVTTDTAANSGCTSPPASCTSGTTKCACYTLQVPSSNPVIGAATTSGTGYSAPAGAPVNFSVDGIATAIGSGTTFECSPSELATMPFDASAGGSVAAPILAFTMCD